MQLIGYIPCPQGVAGVTSTQGWTFFVSGLAQAVLDQWPSTEALCLCHLPCLRLFFWGAVGSQTQSCVPRPAFGLQLTEEALELLGAGPELGSTSSS